MKLFRNLRMTFVDQANFKKYLLYAIGEIFLVMIGISLAFQLDNWNEDRIKQNTAMGHYQNIKSQLADDKLLLEQQVGFNQLYLQQFNYANKIISENDRTKIDTLGQIMRNLSQYSDFDKEGNIYQTLLNSGEIKLLKNIEIVNALQEYEEKSNYLNRMEVIHNKAVMDYVVRATFPAIKLSSGKIMDPDAVYNFQFENLLVSLLSIMDEKQLAYNEALFQIKVITEQIELELND